MQIGVALIVGIFFGLGCLAVAAAFLLLGSAEVFSLLKSATGLSLGGAQPLRISTMTDIHYLSPKLTDNGSYFTEMVNNGDGKTMLVMEELADAFIAQTIADAPNVLILSGDLSFNGEKQSHLDFAEKLTNLTDAGIAVYVLPGNHDLDYRYAASFEGDSYTLVDSVSSEEFREIYANFGYASEQLIAADTESLSYMVQLSDTQALLLIDVNSGVTGVLSDEILAFAEAQLIAAKAAGLQVMAVSHQSLMDHNSMLSFGYTIIKSAPLIALYEEYGVVCNLSGHIHMQHIATSAGGVADIATNALSVYPNQYAALEWGSEELTYQATALDIPAWSETTEATKTGCETFAEYSLACFQSDHSGEFTEALCADYTAAEITAITDWAAEANALYFAGRRDLITPNPDALSALENSGVFFGTYLATIFEDDLEDDTVWTLDFTAENKANA